MTKCWQDHWDEAAEAERRALRARPVAELLAEVRAGRYGRYYEIWTSLAERSSVAEAGWILYHVLLREEDDLIRYHGAAALLRLLDETALAPADLSAEHARRPELMASVRQRLLDRVGPDPGP